jgi:dTDP-4-dehydrorhamnose reductase
MKVLVLGATGLLGSQLVPYLLSLGHEVIGQGKSKKSDINLDLSFYENIEKILELFKPGVVINLIAITNVDECELNPHKAYLNNTLIVQNIVKWIKLRSISTYLIHISSDHLYDGGGLNSEDDIIIRNYYAFSKYAGELAASAIPCGILRTNFFGKSLLPERLSFTDWIYHSLTSGDDIQLFDDVEFSPISIRELCKNIVLMIEKKLIGVFNVGSHYGMSKSDFGFIFAEELGLPRKNIRRVKIDETSKGGAYRPRNMKMNVEIFQRKMNIVLPTLHEEIHSASLEYLL